MNLGVALALVAASFGPVSFVLMLRAAVLCRCEADGYTLSVIGFRWLLSAMWLTLALNTTWVLAVTEGACVVLVFALLLFVAKTKDSSRWHLAGWVASGIALTAVGFVAPIATAIALSVLPAAQVGLAIRDIVRSETAKAVSTSSWVMGFAAQFGWVAESIRSNATHTAAISGVLACLSLVGAVVTFNAHRRAPATSVAATPV